MRTLLVLLVAACSGGGSGGGDDGGLDPSDVEQQNGACTAFEGKQFSSVEPHECGIGPGGIIMCTWTLTFMAQDPQRSGFSWHYSDILESGAVRCTGRSITTDGIGRVHTGSYDLATGRLTWDQLPYQL